MLDSPVKARMVLPVATSHSLKVLSTLPDRNVRPSGEKATELTLSVWPVKVRIRRLVGGCDCALAERGACSIEVTPLATANPTPPHTVCNSWRRVPGEGPDSRPVLPRSRIDMCWL